MIEIGHTKIRTDITIPAQVIMGVVEADNVALAKRPQREKEIRILLLF